MCIDYLTIGGVSYGVYVDRYTGWPGVIAGTLTSDVATFIAKLCEIYGVPETITSDGGPNLTARSVEELMNTYGIYHRISSVANPHANARAELGVKTVKRLLRTNVGAYGTVDTARFTRAMLQLRNTPDRDTRISPAEALFGRKLKDFLPVPKRELIGEMWKDLADKREQALAKRSTKADNAWKEHTRLLKPLVTGDYVFVQNQSGNHKLRWDRSGQVVKVNGFDQYTVKLEGSRRLTIRNRKFLRKFNPYTPPGWTKQTDAAGPATSPPRTPTPDAPPRPPSPPAVPRSVSPPAVEPPAIHCGYAYQPLSAIPVGTNQWRTVEDVLDWAIPTWVEDPQLQGDQGRDVEAPNPPVHEPPPAQPADQRPHGPETPPRRSSRKNKGQTTKFQDYVGDEELPQQDTSD